MDECVALAAWAHSTPVEREPCATQDQIERHFEFMAATLPSRSVDDETGKRKLAVYVTILREWSNDAMSFMAREACMTLQWFPTPSQCLDILRQYPRPFSDQDRALTYCGQFMHDSFETWISGLPLGGEIGDPPRGWIEIAITRNVLRRMADGSLIVRDRYHGPRRVAVA